MPVQRIYFNANTSSSPYGHTQATSDTRGAIMSMFSGLHFQKSPFEVTIRSIKFWHVVADARIGAMAVEPRSGAGVFYRMHAL